MAWTTEQFATCNLAVNAAAVCFGGIGHWDAVDVTVLDATARPVGFAYHLHGWWGDGYALRSGGLACGSERIEFYQLPQGGETLVVHPLEVTWSSSVCGSVSGATAGVVRLAFGH